MGSLLVPLFSLPLDQTGANSAIDHATDSRARIGLQADPASGYSLGTVHDVRSSAMRSPFRGKR